MWIAFKTTILWNLWHFFGATFKGGAVFVITHWLPCDHIDALTEKRLHHRFQNWRHFGCTFFLSVFWLASFSSFHNHHFACFGLFNSSFLGIIFTLTLLRGGGLHSLVHPQHFTWRSLLLSVSPLHIFSNFHCSLFAPCSILIFSLFTSWWFPLLPAPFCNFLCSLLLDSLLSYIILGHSPWSLGS